MGEAELLEIERRADQYPTPARDDVLLLTRELRRLYQTGARQTTGEASAPLYDPLTGLLNSGAYGVRFAMARARATRYRKLFAVMSIDIDFSAASPVPAAERELMTQAVAERLASCVRATDTLARVGKENFAVLLEDLSHPGHAERVKQMVQEALAEPIRVGVTEAAPSVRVQLQFYPGPQPDAAMH